MKRKPTPGGEATDRADDSDQQPDEDKPIGRDDPVSLWPLSFEDVVRALHKTPPMKKEPKGDPD